MAVNSQREISSEIASEYSLLTAYPNPFNPVTTIEYYLAEDAEIQVDIIELSGKKVETLHQGTAPAGYHSLQWDASQLSSGVYFVKLLTKSDAEGVMQDYGFKKLMLLK